MSEHHATSFGQKGGRRARMGVVSREVKGCLCSINYAFASHEES
jgi:hypothetical protein